MICYIKNIGVDFLKGVGIIDFVKSILEGVLSVEKVLIEKYKKGGLFVFLLKLDVYINLNNSV